MDPEELLLLLLRVEATAFTWPPAAGVFFARLDDAEDPDFLATSVFGEVLPAGFSAEALALPEGEEGFSVLVEATDLAGTGVLDF